MSLQQLQFHLINAFAPTSHAGNQAAVVIVPADDPRATDEKWMLTVAADFNLSETAYLVPIEPDAEVPKYGLRWFTPTVVPLCGHATLASAYTLFNYVHPNAKKLAFQSRWRGILGATLESELGQGARIGLDLPTVVTPPAAKAAEWTTALAGALGISESDFVRVVEYDFGEPSAIAEVKESVDIKALKPDFTKISEVVPLVVVTNVNTAKSAPENLDVDSRVFAPGFGIDEDPVTGSAWAALTGYYLDGPGVETTRKVIGDSADPTRVAIDGHQLSARGGAVSTTLVDGRAQVVGSGYRYGFGTLESV